METETLTNYKRIPDEHLVNDSEEENSKNAGELDLPRCKTTSDLDLEKNTDCDNKLEDQDKVSDKGSSGEENYDKQNVTDESDNEVEEEEEHIPLNIHVEKSDDEDGDEGLDGSEKDENEATNDVDDPLSTQDEIVENETSDCDKDLDKSAKDERIEDKDEKEEKIQDEHSNELVSRDSDVDSKEETEAKDENHKETTDNPNTEVLDSIEILKEPVEENSDKDTEMTEDTAEKETDENSSDPLEKEESEKEESTVEEDPLNIESKESAENECNEDPLNTETKAEEHKNLSEPTDDPLKVDIEQLDEKMEVDKPEGDKSVVDQSGVDKLEVDKSDDIDKSKEVDKSEGVGESAEVNISKEVDKSAEADKSEDDKSKKVDKSDDKSKEVDKSEDDKSKEIDKLEEGKSDNKESKNEAMSLLKETLTKNKDDDGPKENEEEDIEMDEDFDPSLLCPDINMEVDEAPVITSNDAPPPVDNTDGNKSPLLYEPIFSTYVDEMTGAEVNFNLTPDEEALRLETFGEKNHVQFTKIHCTACNVHLGSALDGQGNRFVHPLLKVLICKTCYHFYTSGEFEKDEDGSELYCRWCGQGGQVMCCSNCEMVFCKKCIRINFDRKKLAEIRDVDDWLCFRCCPSQLTLQRIHCAEFMEYVRRETQRASTLENPASYMTIDYTQCCTVQKKKQPPETASTSGEPKKKKRKLTTVDPDYDPLKDRETESPTQSTTQATPTTNTPTTSTPGYRIIPPAGSATPSTSKVVPVIPKPGDPSKNGGMVQVNSGFKIGGTTFKPRTGSFTPRPRVQVVGPHAVRASNASPGYIKILPGGVRVQCTPTPRQTFTPRQPLNTTRQITPIRQLRPSLPQPMKHEWFEKTVRAAARVNSNLSYTLTQLNRAQANASSVEALAVVHNKLQEILSTSINSLIQIRKNLRTEFISGIKNIRFPPKPQTTPPAAVLTPTTSAAQDDDVIIVSPPASPPPLTPTTTASTAVNSVNLPPSISLIKKSPTATTTTTITTSSPSTSQSGPIQPKSFLRVKSLTALQCVPSECITIPDDPPPPPPPLALIPKPQAVPENNDTIEIIDDKDEEPQKNGMVNGLDKIKIEMISGNVQDVNELSEPTISTAPEKEKNEKSGSAGISATVTPELLKMKSTRVLLVRSVEVEELIKKTHLGKMNGDVNTS